LGCLLFELLTGDPPYHRDGDGTPLRAHHIQAPVPSVRIVREEVPAELDALVTAMLAKNPDARLTDDELDVLLGNVAALVEAGNGTAALRLMDEGLERAPAGSYAELDLRYRLGTALFYEGEYRRAAALLTAAGDGFRANGMAPAAEHVLECAYLAGHAYVELDDTAAALVQLRYYVHHADRRDDRLLDTRFVTAQLLAAEGLLDEARAELQALHPAFTGRYGPGSVHVHNLERQADRLRHTDSRGTPICRDNPGRLRGAARFPLVEALPTGFEPVTRGCFNPLCRGTHRALTPAASPPPRLPGRRDSRRGASAGQEQQQLAARPADLGALTLGPVQVRRDQPQTRETLLRTVESAAPHVPQSRQHPLERHRADTAQRTRDVLACISRSTSGSIGRVPNGRRAEPAVARSCATNSAGPNSAARRPAESWIIRLMSPRARTIPSTAAGFDRRVPSVR